MYPWEYQALQLHPADSADKLNKQVAQQLAILQSAPQKLADLLVAYRQKRQKIAGDKMISALGVQQQIAAALTEARAAVDALQTEAQTARAEMEITCGRVFGAPADTQAALLREIQEQRAWERWRRLLDSGTIDAFGVVQAAGHAGDLVGLQVLQAELPTYMASRSQAQDAIDSTLEVLNLTERPLLPEVQRRARDLQDEMKAGWYRVNLAFVYTRDELGGVAGAAPGDPNAWLGGGNPGTTSVLPVWGAKEAPIFVGETLPV